MINQSSESDHVHILNGSDREWRIISLYELTKIEHAINEECVSKNDRCMTGHLNEMHDSGNETVDKVRSRPAYLSPDDRGWEQGFQDGQTSATYDMNIRDIEIYHKTLAPIKEIYERFKHLDKILSARDADCPMKQSYSEMWIVIRGLCDGGNK